MGSDIGIELEDVKLPGTTKYKIGDVVKNLMSNKEYKITEIKDGKYKLKTNIESELPITPDIATVDNESLYKPVKDTEAESKADSKGTDADPKEGAKGTEAEFKAESKAYVKGTETKAESKEGAMTAAAVSSATSSATPTFVYVIVQISETGEISILDEVPKDKPLNTTDPPMYLLSNKIQSIFAIKITRKPGCTEHCIDGYELGLKETVSSVSQNELLSENFLEDTAESASSSVSSSSVSEEVPLVKENSDEEKKIKFSNILIDMGLATDESFQKLVEKYYNENYDEAIGKILNDIDSEKPIDAPSGSESSASSGPVIGGTHGPYGLRQVSGTDCFISSVIHLMKDITSYDPNNPPGDGCNEITYSGTSYNAKIINILTNELYKYISGTSDKIEEYKKFNPEHYKQAYTDLRKILDFKPGFGETTETINVYSEIANCIKPETLTVHNLQNENDIREHGKTSDFENDGVTIKTNFTTYRNTEYLVLNRTVKSNDRDIWMAIEFPQEKDGYSLIGKILHPPGHFVYVNYSDYENPVIYNDSVVEKFKIRDENVGKTQASTDVLRNIKYISGFNEEERDKQLETQNMYLATPTENLVNKEKQLTTSVLYKKIPTSPSTSKGGSSRRKQKSKSKKTRRKYFVYNK